MTMEGIPAELTIRPVLKLDNGKVKRLEVVGVEASDNCCSLWNSHW